MTIEKNAEVDAKIESELRSYAQFAAVQRKKYIDRQIKAEENKEHVDDHQHNNNSNKFSAGDDRVCDSDTLSALDFEFEYFDTNQSESTCDQLHINGLPVYPIKLIDYQETICAQDNDDFRDTVGLTKRDAEHRKTSENK